MSKKVVKRNPSKKKVIKASAEAIRDKTYRKNYAEAFDKKTHECSIWIYIAILIMGILLGFSLTTHTNCEVAEDELSACYDGCEFSDLPNYEYNKCTLFCKTTYGPNMKLLCKE